MIIDVDDDGVGLPEGFDLEGSTNLGLTIVGTQVESELAGTIVLGPSPSGSGTRARLEVPLD
jgi:two-component sensor histidine kinase